MPESTVAHGLTSKYLALARAAMARVVVFLGGHGASEEALSQLYKAFDERRQRLGGWSPLAQQLGTTKELVEACTASLRLVIAQEESIAQGAAAPKDELLVLRLLYQIERMVENKWDVDLGIQLPEPDQHKLVRGQQQVRALELVIRSLIGEAYGGQQKLTKELTNWLGSERVQQWSHAADAGDLLSGTSFSDLARLFIDEKQYPKRYASLYEKTPYLQLLTDKRRTLAQFLDDIRAIRNRIAHHKRITEVQVSLLDSYYTEVIAPVQQAYDEHRIGVNPDSYFDASSQQLAAYFDRVEERLNRLGDDVADIREGMEKIGGKLTEILIAIRQHQGVVLASLAGLGVVALLTLYLTAGTNIAVRGVKKETSDDPRKELANRGVAWRADEFRSAIDRGDVDTAQLFLDGGMKWRSHYAYKVLDSDDRKMIDVLAGKPGSLEPGDCKDLMTHLARTDPTTISYKDRGRSERPHQLTSAETKVLKIMCSKPVDLAYAQSTYDEARQRYQSELAKYQTAKAAIKPEAQCIGEASADNYRPLKNAVYSHDYLHPSSDGILESMLAELYVASNKGPIPQAMLASAVAKFCKARSTEEPRINISEANSLARKRILDAIH